MKVIIADSDPEITEMIASELISEFNTELIQTVQAHDGRNILSLLKIESPQLLILDWVLPELCGLQLIQEIRKHKNSDDLAILLLCNPLSDECLATAVEAGVNDYLFKPYQRPQLLARVKALKKQFLKKDEPLVQRLGEYEFGKFRLNIRTSDFYQGEERTHLTPSEFKLLETLFKNAGRILTRDQLIAQVQGEGVAVIDRAIDTHVFALRKKMGEYADLIETVRGVGYRVKLP